MSTNLEYTAGERHGKRESRPAKLNEKKGDRAGGLEQAIKKQRLHFFVGITT